MRDRGFTLIELLVATALFAMVSVMAFNGLTAVMHQSALLERKATQTRALLRATTLLRRDLEAATPVTFDAISDGKKAVQTLPNGFSLMRGGIPKMPFETGGGFARIDWIVKDNMLIRRQHGNGNTTRTTEQPLLKDVVSLSLTPLSKANTDAVQNATLPPAFEVKLTVRQLGVLRLVVTR